MTVKWVTKMILSSRKSHTFGSRFLKIRDVFSSKRGLTFRKVFGFVRRFCFDLVAEKHFSLLWKVHSSLRAQKLF